MWSKHVQALSLDMITVLGDRAEQVVFCFGSEMRARSLYVMPPKYSNYLDPKEPLFGPVVHEKFKQKGRYEIAEAGRCLALGCNTACVFHLMRTVEVALEAVRLCLQLPIPQKKGDKTWGAALGSFEAELNNKDNLLWPKQWSSMADKKIFSEIHASLLLFKSEWRDPTMHLESTYDPDAAAHLFALVKGFMQKVANRLDETGHPYA